MKKLLIFGASGFGPYLAQEFIDEGYKVFGSDIERCDWLLDGFSNQAPVISRPESLLAFKDLPNCYYTYTDINTFLSSVNQIRKNP